MDRRLPALGALIMSEYQYYEFLAVDRPLTVAEQAEVREFSTRRRLGTALDTGNGTASGDSGLRDCWVTATGRSDVTELRGWRMEDLPRA
jgi:hypothetical protein